MAHHDWAIPELSKLLPLEEGELKQILTFTDTLSDTEATQHLENLLGSSPEALEFITSFTAHRQKSQAATSFGDYDTKHAPPEKSAQEDVATSSKQANGGSSSQDVGQLSSDSKHAYDTKDAVPPPYPPPSHMPPSHPPPMSGSSRSSAARHTNQVIEAAKIRAVDEQEMQNALQNLQYRYNIYNSDIEPEHETDWPCGCPICQYKWRKRSRANVQNIWSNAVMYPGERAYTDLYQTSNSIFSNNPYGSRVISPYGMQWSSWGPSRPSPRYHAMSIHQTISLNNNLNRQAQQAIDSKEPRVNIWAEEDGNLSQEMSNLTVGDKKLSSTPTDSKRLSVTPSNDSAATKSSKMSSFRKSIGLKSSEEKVVAKAHKAAGKNLELRNAILAEERGRWPDEQWRNIVEIYLEKVGMTKKVAELRARSPIQYLHLLRAGFFEPIPVAWANQASNPLKFSIEAASGWRGLTPAWRGYEDTAEERLYWVLNHREGSVGMRMKPDMISELNMARDRMAKAVEPPPQYYSATDVCHVQHTSDGYSKQVMPTPFRAFDRPEVPTDDTMILLDISGSMDFDPLRPVYDQYLITGYARSTQPKNKDVAKAVIRRFADAMSVHDQEFRGYDLTTFSSQAHYVGTVNHQNLDSMWRKIRIGGGTRVMTGWQKVKELHFQKHSESATYHPVYGWQAGPETPMLRLLLLLDGEATDMDEFELDLLSLSWAHVTIFLIGVDGCPHHHRHANELQRISDVNHHVSFVDAQGNCPERFVTHELLKRHLGYDVSYQEFESMEELPPYPG